MNDKISSIIYPAKDLDKTKALFNTLLGTQPSQDSAYYVGYQVGNLNIGLDPNGHKRGWKGAVPYFNVENIKEKVASLQKSGGKVIEDIHDIGNGGLIASVQDTEGNVIGLMQRSK